MSKEVWPWIPSNSCFYLGSWYKILCAPCKNDVSISPASPSPRPCPVGLLKLSPTGLQCQILQNLIFPVQDPRVGEPKVGLRTDSSGTALYLFLFVGSAAGAMGLGNIL